MAVCGQPRLPAAVSGLQCGRIGSRNLSGTKPRNQVMSYSARHDIGDADERIDFNNEGKK